MLHEVVSITCDAEDCKAYTEGRGGWYSRVVSTAARNGWRFLPDGRHLCPHHAEDGA